MKKPILNQWERQLIIMDTMNGAFLELHIEKLRLKREIDNILRPISNLIVKCYRKMKSKINNVEVRIEANPIDVTPMQEPDPEWEYECECGINHKYHSNDADFKNSPAMCEAGLPTLDYIIDFEGGPDLPAEGHYECIECSETIKPGQRTPFKRYYISGRKDYYINDELVSEDEFKRVIDK